ncbi:CBS domain-containing protein [Donghicola sp. C2-DW-16]|uniref:CBS domain-containing protein n=1 Tax=Donghicola mangrovi TaxID=2729614 RepID=A0ABX2PC38_9RHOB|nr:CBS domain-containing protein [Donghicola mangrovi]NVO26943.1 CBS domain-containing protein [Donghicola mangrovi]
MLVQQILSSKGQQGVFTVQPETTVSEAIKILAANRIGTVLVSKDGKHPDGILSERDVVRELANRGQSVLDEPVSALMTSNLVTCAKGSLTEEVMQKMTDGRFRHMPVLEDGEVIGVISLGDVVKAQLSHVAMEKEALEGMIMGQ